MLETRHSVAHGNYLLPLFGLSLIKLWQIILIVMFYQYTFHPRTSYNIVCIQSISLLIFAHSQSMESSNSQEPQASYVGWLTAP